MGAAPGEAAAREPLTQRIVGVFLRGNLAVLLILIPLLGGAVALWVTPREEELQILVPFADLLVSVPGRIEVHRGLRAREVVRLVGDRRGS